MEEQTRSGSRRTRFIDDAQIGNLPDENASSIFGKTSAAPTFAVLHDTVPDLGNRSDESRVRIAEPSPTLANLTAEFKDLSRKMSLLKETIKATRKGGTTKKSGPPRTNSSSQALQVGNLSSVATAKLVVQDCISELTSIFHFLDGNEDIAAVYREKLRHAIANEDGKADAIVIQGVSLALNTYSPIPRGGNATTDSAAGASHQSLSRYRKEAEIQTEAEQTEGSEGLTDESVTKFPDANVSSKPTGKASQQSKRGAQKKSRK